VNSAGPRISGAWRRAFDGDSAAASEPAFGIYVADLARPYGLPLRDDLIKAGRGQSYGEMAGDLLAEKLSPDEPIDLLVLAFAVSDVVPERATASHLSYRCPGSPLAFAVCDQGSAAPFTGLRLIREYFRAGSCERAMLVTAEQSVLHYQLGTPAPVPATHAVVALLCDRSGAGRPAAVRQHANVAPGRVASLLAGELTGTGAGHGEVTLVAGTALAEIAGAALTGTGVRLLIAPEGQPCTGVWWDAAGRLATSPGPGRLLLADYDPLLGNLSICAIGVSLLSNCGYSAAGHQSAPIPIDAGPIDVAHCPARRLRVLIVRITQKGECNCVATLSEPHNGTKQPQRE
jgi:4-hydroxymandelate oxidase